VVRLILISSSNNYPNMSSKIGLWTGFLGIGTTIFLIQPPSATAVTKTAIEIAETARAITVLISDGQTQGSGVILQHQGDIYTILTAAHVVKSPSSYQITTPDGQQYLAIDSSRRAAPGQIDVAVIKFKSKTKYPTAKLGNCHALKSGMDLYVAGFPAATRVLTKSVFVFREGRVSANSNQTFENGYSLVYSNDTLPGMSGGGVLNTNGEIVAIHGRGDREQLTDGTLGNKTGFNVGIPIDRVAAIASNLGVQLSPPIRSIPPTVTPRADDYVAAAAQKYRNRDYRGALADYDRAISLNPKSAPAYNYRGVLKEKIQDIAGGLADYNQAIALNANYGEAYNNRGKLKLNRLQDHQGALADYDLAIELSPKFATAYANRGYLQVKLMKVASGLADFNRAIQLEPNEASYYSYRGFLKIITSDRQGALADLSRALELNPSDAATYLKRGDFKYYTLKDRDGGIVDLEVAARLSQQQENTEVYRQTTIRLNRWRQLKKAGSEA
jgi:S1-C subfamily serine protease/lipoprotein NlpI